MKISIVKLEQKTSSGILASCYGKRVGLPRHGSAWATSIRKFINLYCCPYEIFMGIILQ